VSERFDALLPLLAPGGYGYEVVVTNEGGDRTRGRITSISTGAITIDTRTTLPLFRRFTGREQTFVASSVRTIQIVDSVWNGFLLGAAASVGFVFMSAEFCSTSLCPWVFLAATAPFLGEAIDLHVNSPIYQRPPRTSRIRIVPALGPNQAGILAAVCFR
jgi:hypothetical protein